ncbi:MAG: universal stress protein [Betaproteobacteria bacterium]|nr:MAG: universal stress protein [Betaproteobacteria bacterium]
MFRQLVPIDGSDSAYRALRFVCAGPCDDTEIHVLNVQEPIVDWEVRRFMRDDEIEAMLRAKAETFLAEAEAIAVAAGRRVVRHLYLGETAHGIAEQAKALACDQIVMGSRGMSALQGMLLGSISSKVLHLVDIPVTLVK